MSLPIAYRRKARVEYDAAFDRYERQRPGLGLRFVAAVDKRLGVIAADPLRYAAVYRDVREADVVRFRKYRIYYIAEPTRVLVLSVFHTSRNPIIWKRRRNTP
jgi:toxin ParE1/3/4